MDKMDTMDTMDEMGVGEEGKSGGMLLGLGRGGAPREGARW
jgi:hypothetical protein